VSERKGTSWAEDCCIVLATVVTLETLKFAFGWQVACAAGVTCLIGCLAFLYHAGKSA
jgi:hypothetical protein